MPESAALVDAERVEAFGVVGAGTMGAGIAQAAAQAGLSVRVYDVEERFVERGRQAIGGSLGRSVERGRLSEADRDAVLGRLTFATDMTVFRDCDFVVEAVPEDPSLKAQVFQSLNRVCPPEAILASNTSSLSVTEIGHASGRPASVVGMHFFNPPVAMRLVEVVRGEASDPRAVAATQVMARRLGKTPVVCRDTPGFIVNRVARPFYLRALEMLAEGAADVPTIDGAVRALGFPMGPFQLMDLIGIDVNFAVTRSVFDQRFHEARFRPHLIQQGLVRAGRLGRKSGVGFYDYRSDPPVPALENTAPASSPSPGPWDAWAPHAGDGSAPVAGRILSSLVNEAYFALGEGVASAEDIDAGMRLGTNYPKGLIAWGNEIGLDLVLETLLALEDWFRDGRFSPAPALRARAIAGPR